MATGLVIYYSKSGNTKQMANTIAETMSQSGVATACKSIDDIEIDDLTAVDAIVVGSPVYYGNMTSEIMHFFERSTSKLGKLDGKVGAAFSSSANIGGGNETTIIAIINAMMVHGMVVQGDPTRSHFGPVSTGKPDASVLAQCKRKAKRVAELTLKLHK